MKNAWLGWLIAAVFILSPDSAKAQTWLQTAELAHQAPMSGDAFGQTLAVSGDIAIGGTQTGSVSVFERNLGGPNAWGRRAELLSPPGIFPFGNGRFGDAVAVHDDTILVGAFSNDNGTGVYTGAAYVFERDHGGPDAWGLAATLIPSDGVTGDYFGVSVALYGDTAIVGAYAHSAVAQYSGIAYVYERDHGGPGAWGEAKKIIPLDASSGDGFGLQVALWKDTAAIGSQFTTGFRGAVYVFDRDFGGPDAWGERAKLEASDGISGDFLSTTSIWEDTIVAGAPFSDTNGVDSGAAYVFERDLGGPNAWGERAKIVPADGSYADFFGWYTTIRHDRLMVSCKGSDPNGAVYVYERDFGGPNAWGQANKLLPLILTGSQDCFGWAVSYDGHTLLASNPCAWQGIENGAGAAHVYEHLAAATPYCSAGVSGSGCQAALAAYGEPSATDAAGFWVEATGVEGASPGLLFFGANGRQQAPWGNGTSFQCVVPPMHRAGLLPATGTPGACDGYFQQDLNERWCPTCPKAHHNPGPGTTAQIQLWYYDPLSTSNRASSLSDAIEVTLTP